MLASILLLKQTLQVGRATAAGPVMCPLEKGKEESIQACLTFIGTGLAGHSRAATKSQVQFTASYQQMLCIAAVGCSAQRIDKRPGRGISSIPAELPMIVMDI